MKITFDLKKTIFSVRNPSQKTTGALDDLSEVIYCPFEMTISGVQNPSQKTTGALDDLSKVFYCCIEMTILSVQNDHAVMKFVSSNHYQFWWKDSEVKKFLQKKNEPIIVKRVGILKCEMLFGEKNDYFSN